MLVICGHEKGVNHSVLILKSGNRQVTMQLNKQEQFTPYRTRTFCSTCSQLRILAVSIWERQEQKAHVSKKDCERGLRDAQFPSPVNTDCLLNDPLLGAQHAVPSFMRSPHWLSYLIGISSLLIGSTLIWFISYISRSYIYYRALISYYVAHLVGKYTKLFPYSDAFLRKNEEKGLWWHRKASAGIPGCK